jgi:hypothetical protein
VPPTAAMSVYRTDWDEVFVDGVVEHHREHGHGSGHGRRRVMLAERLGPGADRQRGYLAERRMLPVGEVVVAEGGAVVLFGPRLYVQCLHPPAGPRRDTDLRAIRQ